MSIAGGLARIGSVTVFAEMFADFPPGTSKQVSQQIRSSSAVIFLFSSLLVPCYCVEETTTPVHINSTFLNVDFIKMSSTTSTRVTLALHPIIL